MITTEDFEKQIIGIMLIENTCVADVLTSITPQHFTSEPSRSLFECMRDIFHSGREITPDTLKIEANKRNLNVLDSDISSLITHAGSSISLPEYIKALIQKKTESKITQLR